MTNEYDQTLILSGMRDAVLSVSFSSKAKFVSATGFAGVIIWDLSCGTPVSSPQIICAPQNPKYIISASAWLYFPKYDRHILVLGSLRGDVLLWQWDSAVNAFQRLHRIPSVNAERQVLSLDVYEREVSSGHRGRIVGATIDGCVTVWALSAVGELTQVFSCTLEILPKTVRFCPHTRDLLVFAQIGGIILRLDHRSGDIRSRRDNGPRIMGSVALNRAADKFVAWTGDGFQLHTLSNLELIRTFGGHRPVVHFPKHVVFGEKDGIIIGGTDRGCGLIYNLHHNEAVQTLDYHRGGLVQHVAAITLPERHLIAIAGSTRYQPADVVIYQKLVQKGTAQSEDYEPLISSNARKVTPQGPVLVRFYVSNTVWKVIQTSLLAIVVLGLATVFTYSNAGQWFVEVRRDILKF
ncbi:WD40-repeat-containing domain protein [Lentinula raphanica]|nr:WD40-repeat-containing domain protein [Lentinula raphanica]